MTTAAPNPKATQADDTRIEGHVDRIMAALIEAKPEPASAAHSPAVVRALADIEAAKRDVDADVAACLDAVADLIRQTGDPDAVFDRVLDNFAREELRVLTAAHGLRLAESSAEAVESGDLTETLVFWEFNGSALAVVPRGQRPADTLRQLRAAIDERADEQQLADSFQASVAAGDVEDLDSWHARVTTEAAR
ncbi:hypothetical protein [Streptomyces sp. NPDC050164]|uniref:hypothetical protein n=1 Tax=Streptomyces sp. NPDC050164 TaxID=3365605 RepID=UPI0037A8798F